MTHLYSSLERLHDCIVLGRKISKTEFAGFMQLQEVNGGEPLSVLSDDVRAAIMKNITRRMTPQPLKIRADVDMTCFAYDGVLHIQVSMHHFMDPACKQYAIRHTTGCSWLKRLPSWRLATQTFLFCLRLGTSPV